MKPLDRTGQVWEDMNPGSDPPIQRFVVVGPAFLEDGDHIHPILNLDTGEHDTWYEFQDMPWECAHDIERLL